MQGRQQLGAIGTENAVAMLWRARQMATNNRNSAENSQGRERTHAKRQGCCMAHQWVHAQLGMGPHLDKEDGDPANHCEKTKHKEMETVVRRRELVDQPAPEVRHFSRHKQNRSRRRPPHMPPFEGPHAVVVPSKDCFGVRYLFLACLVFSRTVRWWCACGNVSRQRQIRSGKAAANNRHNLCDASRPRLTDFSCPTATDGQCISTAMPRHRSPRPCWP